MTKDEIQDAIRNLARECSKQAQTSHDEPVHGNLSSAKTYWNRWASGLNDIANGLAMTDLD